MATLTEKLIFQTARKNLTVCMLADDKEQVNVTAKRLENAGFPVARLTSVPETLQQIRLGACHVILADFKASTADSKNFLEQALQCDPGLYVILITEQYSVDSAIEAVKHGAYDYLSKPVDFTRLEKTLDELTNLFTRRSQIRDLEQKLLHNLEFHGIISRSPAIFEILEFAKKISRHYSNVLITGPTGAGKELIARAIHRMSPISQDRFVVCNCSALADTLLESELFGHMRGSFTGATETRQGLFEFANDGTVFLDEIGETSLAMQAKLLRVIQNREIQRVGSPETKKIQARVIAATNRDLRADVLAGRFREDLFYRLSSIEIRVPGLRERPGDIPILAQHFLRKYGEAYGKPFQGISRRAQIALFQHNWPGNIRELENVISSAAIAAAADFIDVWDLPEHLQKPRHGAARTEESWRPLPLDEIRRIHIERVLEMCNGNRVRAAQTLGIGRTSLYRFLKSSARAAAKAQRAC